MSASDLRDGTQAAVLEAKQNHGVSASLAASGLPLEQFYDIPGVARFIRDHRLRVVALQFPDELLMDAWAIIRAAKAQLLHDQQAVCESETAAKTEDVSFDAQDVQFYVLGDTSYGSCCVDIIAAQHVSADGIVHFGFACMTPTRSMPVYFVHGVRKVDESAIVATLSDLQSLQQLFPSIEQEILSGASPTATDSQDSPERCVTVPVANLYILYDRMFTQSIPSIAKRLAAKGVQVTMGPKAEPIAADEPISVGKRPHNIRIIFAAMRDSDDSQLHNAQASGSHKIPISEIEFAGFKLPTGNENVPLAKLPDVWGDEDDCDSYATYENADQAQSKVYLEARKKTMQPAQSAILTLCALQTTADETTTDAPAAVEALRAPKPTTMCGGYASQAFEKSSAALLINSVVNFSGYTVAAMSIPGHKPGSEDSDRKLTISVYSGQKRFAQLLGKRYYQVVSACNASVFGIVASALSSATQLATIRRIQNLVKAYGKKAYVLSIGKLNEPKLLNFPEIEVFVIAGCPFTSLVETPHGWAAKLITAVELEYALTGTEWSGDYSTDASVIVGETALDTSESTATKEKVLLVDREEGPSMLALNDEEAEAMTEITADSEFMNSHSRVEESRETNQSRNPRTTQNLRVGDEPTEAEKSFGFVNDEDAPRFSLIDQKLHVNVTRKLVQEAKTSTGSSNQLVDISGKSSGALIEDISYKPLQRSFTGLDPSVENLPEAALRIQKGLHGVARAYVTYGESYTNHPTMGPKGEAKTDPK